MAAMTVIIEASILSAVSAFDNGIIFVEEGNRKKSIVAFDTLRMMSGLPLSTRIFLQNHPIYKKALLTAICMYDLTSTIGEQNLFFSIAKMFFCIYERI
jgi:hypothetical protein